MSRVRVGRGVEIIALLIVMILLLQDHKVFYAVASLKYDWEPSTLPAVGMHIGSHVSRVAYRDAESLNTTIVSDGDGNKDVISCVAFTEGGPLVGASAVLRSSKYPETVVCDPMALLGRRWSDPDMQQLIQSLNYTVLRGHDDEILISVKVGDQEARTYTPEYVTSLILGQLRGMAEAMLGGNVTEAVVTVPVYYEYSDNEKEAIKTAGELAGIEIIRFTREPIAVYLAYRLDKDYEDERIILYLDVNDGLDVSLWMVDLGIHDLIAVARLPFVGTDPYRLKPDSQSTRWTSINTSLNPSDVRNIDPETGKPRISPIHPAFVASLSRPQFESAAQYRFEAVAQSISQVLAEASVDITRIDFVALSGGSHNLPEIDNFIQDVFPAHMIVRDLGDEAVITGAARLAGMLSGIDDEKPYVPCACTYMKWSPWTYGIETVYGIMARIIKPGLIPASIPRVYSTAIDGQSSMLIKVVGGQRIMALSNLLLGEIEMPLTPAPAGVARVEVRFAINSDLVVNVTATDLATNRTQYLILPSPDKVPHTTSEPASESRSCSHTSTLGATCPALLIDPERDESGRKYARVELESYLAALQERLSATVDSENVATSQVSNETRPDVDEDDEDNNRPPPTVTRSEVLNDIKTAQEYIAANREVWKAEHFENLLDIFSLLADSLGVQVSYDAGYEVGGKAMGPDINEL